MVNMDTIRGLCKAHGITLAELEREAGIGNGIIARWEKANPRVDTLAKVADYFRVTVDALLKNGH